MAEYPLHARWYAPYGLPVLKVLLWPLFLILGPLKVVGAYRVPRKGGVLILATHPSDFDPVLIQYGSPRPLYFMAKRDLFSMGWLGRLIPQLGAFPVDPDAPDRASLRQAVWYLKQGYPVVVFPEGRVRIGGEPLPLKPGAALIARMADVPILCAAFRNSERVIPYGKVIPRPAFRTVQCIWGEPKRFDPAATPEEVMRWVEVQFRELSLD